MVYAFSRTQAAAALGLAGQLWVASWADIGPQDDVLLSCASPKPRLCRDLGALRPCATSNQPGIASWTSEGFGERRFEVPGVSP